MTTGSTPPAQGATLALASVGQRQLWMHDRMYAHDGSYNISLGIRFKGHLDAAALEVALNSVIARHEPLRTSFLLESDDLYQVIAETLTVEMRTVVLDADAGDRWATVHQRLAEDGAIPFDLGTPPLLRTTLYRLDDHDHALTLVLHHTVFDGWSVGILLKELAEFYNASQTHRRVDLAPIETQFADFAEWQRDQIASAANAPAVEYWRRQLADAPLRIELPTDRPRQSLGGGRPGRLLVRRAPMSLRNDLANLARAEKGTLFMVLFTGFAVLLHRYAQQADLLIGTPVAGRTRSELEGLIGHFVNTVLVRSTMEADATFRELLAQARVRTLEAQTHQDVPFDQLNEILRRSGGVEQAPLLQVMLALQSATPEPPPFEGLEASLFWGHNGTSKYDLFLNIIEEPTGLRYELEYDTDLFDEATADRLLDSYGVLLQAIAATPGERVRRLPILSDADLCTIADANATTVDYPRDESVASVFASVAGRWPDRLALRCGHERMTYAELDQQANQVAHALIAQGVGPDVLVGVALDRSIDLVVGILGILKAGGAYLPLDASYPAARLAFMVSDSRVGIVLTDGHSPGLPAGLTVLDIRALRANQATTAPPTRAAATDLAYVMYTSGSTGQPKGVAIPNRGIVRLVCGSAFVDWSNVQVILHMAPIAFDASTFELWGGLLNGATVALLPERHVTLDGLAAALRADNVDTLWLTAAFFNVIIDARPEILRGVRQLLAGGEALSVPHVRRAQAALPTTRLINGYGPTESTTFACCYSIPPSLDASISSIPIGRPIANTTAAIVDPNGERSPVGVPGELWLGGDGLARGYLNHPTLTDERFVTTASGRWYRTGDQVRWRADGTIEFLGRLDRQVKLRGFRIELGEIESVMAQAPGVRQSAVVVRTDEAGDSRLIAYIVGASGASPSSDDLRAHAEAHLPAYMLPTTFVLVDEFKLTSNGKIDRQALPDPSPTAESAAAFVEPRTTAEKQLASVWREVLGTERIGATDNFFHLGGHSLMAIRLFGRIRETMGIELPFGLLLRHQTVEALAAEIARRQNPDAAGATASALTPLHAAGTRPPMFFTHGVGGEVWSFTALTRHLGDDQPVYGLQPVHGLAESHFTVPHIAEQYIAEIRTVAPHGPYMLGGHCTGAAVAFEMARQLRAAGENVGLVAVLDYPLADSLDTRLPVRLAKCVRNLPRWLLEDLSQVSGATIKGRIRSQTRKLVGRLRGMVLRKKKTVDIRDRLGMWRFPDYQVAALEQAFAAFQSYKPPPYDGDVLLIKARTLPLFPFGTPVDMGWARVVRGRLTIADVKGSHETILQEPLVAHTAAVLRAAIDRVIADNG